MARKPARTEAQPAEVEENKTTETDEGQQAGAHEEAHEQAMRTLEALADDAPINLATLVADLRDGMIEVFKHRPRPWAQLSSGEQKDVATTLEYAAKSFLRRTVIALASEGRESIRVKIEGYGEKDGIKINLSLGSMPPEQQGEAILLLHKNVKREVLLIPADAADYSNQRPAKTDKDEPEMDFSDPPAPPADDSDLAGEQKPEGEDEAAAAGEAEIQTAEQDD